MSAPNASAAAAISDAVVAMLREHSGSEPTGASTVMSADLAVVTLRDWPTTAERTLGGEDDFALVMQMRTALHRGMRTEATAAVEAITGRRVVAYFTDQHHDPDIAIIAFHFEPASEIESTG